MKLKMYEFKMFRLEDWTPKQLVRIVEEMPGTPVKSAQGNVIGQVLRAELREDGVYAIIEGNFLD